MHYFTEHLSRINCVSVCIDIDEAPVELIASGTTLVIRFASSRSVDIPLCSEVKPAVIKTTDVQSNITIRLPCFGQPSRPRDFWRFPVPLKASDVTPHSRFTCTVCQHLVTDKVEKFKSMPSENWAELMDFWHCHKPHEETDQIRPDRFEINAPNPGVAFVGDSFFWFNSEDISYCPHINTAKVWKWDLDVNSIHVSTEVFIAAMLRELVNSHAIYSFFITDNGERSVLVWIFNLDSLVSITGSGPQKGVKLCYSLEKSEWPALRATQGEIEDVVLPTNAVEALRTRLAAVNELLPVNLKKMGEWNLGFLAEQDEH